MANISKVKIGSTTYDLQMTDQPPIADATQSGLMSNAMYRLLDSCDSGAKNSSGTITRFGSVTTGSVGVDLHSITLTASSMSLGTIGGTNIGVLMPYPITYSTAQTTTLNDSYFMYDLNAAQATISLSSNASKNSVHIIYAHNGLYVQPNGINWVLNGTDKSTIGSYVSNSNSVFLVLGRLGNGSWYGYYSTPPSF